MTKKIHSRLHAWRGWLLSAYLIPVALGIMGLKPTFAWTGLTLVGLGLLLRWTAALYTHSLTSSQQWTAPFLARHGIYSLTRNPLYLSNVLATGGILLWVNLPQVWLNLGVLALVFLHHEIIIHGEEQWLKGRFGMAYVKYAAEVPRWMGWPRTRRGTTWKPITSWKNATLTQLPNMLKLFLILLSLAAVKYASFV